MKHERTIALNRNLDLQGSDAEAEGCKSESDTEPEYVQTPRSKKSNEVHIEYRKCKQRKCDVCKPSLTNYYNHDAVDPVLFTRWEKKTTHNNGVTLMKVHYKVNVGEGCYLGRRKVWVGFEEKKFYKTTKHIMGIIS